MNEKRARQRSRADEPKGEIVFHCSHPDFNTIRRKSKDEKSQIIT